MFGKSETISACSCSRLECTSETTVAFSQALQITSQHTKTSKRLLKRLAFHRRQTFVSLRSSLRRHFFPSPVHAQSHITSRNIHQREVPKACSVRAYASNKSSHIANAKAGLFCLLLQAQNPRDTQTFHTVTDPKNQISPESSEGKEARQICHSRHQKRAAPGNDVQKCSKQQKTASLGMTVEGTEWRENHK